MNLLSAVLSGHRFLQGFPVLPGELPIVGHLPILIYDAVGALRRGAETLGPAFWVRLGPSNPILFLSGDESFELFKVRSLTMKGAFSGLEPMIGDSTIVRDGAAHARVRGALNPTFSMRGLFSTGIGKLMADVISARVDSWVNKRQVTVLRETQELALDIIFRVAGVPLADMPRWHRQNREMSLLLLPFRVDLPGLPARRAKRAIAWIDAELLEIVQLAKREPNGTSLTHSLVSARDEAGQGLTDRELVDNLRILLFAGHETTAAALAFLTFTLAQRPELWDKLCTESCRLDASTSTDASSGAPGLPVSISDAKALPFGEALFREVMRRHSPIWFTRRKLIEDLVYRGRRIPAGTSIGFGLGSYLMDPARYPNPERFDPGRWLGRSAGPLPIEMAGFGGGAHFCLGYHLAWLEVQQFLVALAQKMHAAGLRPQIPDGPAPREYFFPLRHPSAAGRVAFV